MNVRTPSERGFVLVLVLVMLVVLAGLAASVSLVSERQRSEQWAQQQAFRDELNAESTRATVLYLLSTQRQTFAGLTVDDRIVRSVDEEAMRDDPNGGFSLMPVGNEIRLDGSPYRGLGRIRFALQDDRGLIGVNWAWPPWIDRALAQAGAPERARLALRERLLDYQDADDLYRINSFDREQYLKAGRPPPSGRALVTPLELRRVMGWDEALAGFDDMDLVDTFTVVRNPVLNLNTAPERVLRVLSGLDAANVSRLIATRRIAPLLSVDALPQITGNMPAEFEMLALYPAPSGVLKLWSEDGGKVRVVHWTLTAIDDGGKPWREDYEFTLAQSSDAPAPVAQPTQAALFAEPLSSAQ